MAKVTCDRAIKAIILLVLLVMFFYLFFWQVVVQYSEELTNTAKTVQKAEIIEMPTFAICSGFKKSLFKEYKISPMIFNMPPGRNSNLPFNATLRTLFDDLVFKLNRDFIIGVGLSFLGLSVQVLELGMNEIKTEDSIYKFEVKEIPTHVYGMCYAIIPMEMSIAVCFNTRN